MKFSNYFKKKSYSPITSSQQKYGIMANPKYTAWNMISWIFLNDENKVVKVFLNHGIVTH